MVSRLLVISKLLISLLLLLQREVFRVYHSISHLPILFIIEISSIYLPSLREEMDLLLMMMMKKVMILNNLIWLLFLCLWPIFQNVSLRSSASQRDSLSHSKRKLINMLPSILYLEREEKNKKLRN
jgi:hypothetical protein